MSMLSVAFVPRLTISPSNSTENITNDGWLVNKYSVLLQPNELEPKIESGKCFIHVMCLCRSMCQVVSRTCYLPSSVITF